MNESIPRWRDALGADKVALDPQTIDRYTANVSEFAPRAIVAVLYPESRADVEALVGIARHHRCPLYPFSTGRNWGVGSKLPITDGCALVDLSRMRRISRLDREARVAVVEPGVTQSQLARHLTDHAPELSVNVTGSGTETSVVGNALDRGVGIHGQRSRDIRGLEVVLGTGQVVRTGGWRGPSTGPLALHYPEGLGPDLTGLFVQSNLGIVTAMALALRRRSEAALAFIELEDAHLERVVDALASLRADGVVSDRIEIDYGNDPRLAEMIDAGSTRPGWGVWVTLTGSAAMRAAKRGELEAALREHRRRLELFERADVEPGGLAHPVAVRFGLVDGQPSSYSIASMARAHGVDPARAEAVDLDHEHGIPGFVCALPAVPFTGAWVRRAAEVVLAANRSWGVDAAMSYNSVSETALEGYVRLMFDRRDRSAVERAHRWCADIHERLRTAGLLPMRLDVERMAAFVEPAASFWQAVTVLKKAFDPAGILAPGRYAPIHVGAR